MGTIKQEACEVFIEQEIATGLKEGKTPYSIGKDLSAWVAKLFEAKIPPATITKRAQREKNKDKCPEINPMQYQEDTAKPNSVLELTIKQRKQKEGFRTLFTGENEWYTPPYYIDLARQVMGTIDLDPATSEYAQKYIKATEYYTLKEDGLTHPWKGNIWLNPPYSQPAIQHFIEKTIYEKNKGRLKQAIVLTNNYTDTKWFHLLAENCHLICFTKGRIYWKSQNKEEARPTQGSSFFYLGHNQNRFHKVFSEVGFVCKRLQPHALGL